MNEVLVERRGDVVWLTFNRPEARNAMTFAMYERMAEVAGEVDADRGVRALVLTGAGGAFVSGTDISQFSAFAEEHDALDVPRILPEDVRPVVQHMRLQVRFERLNRAIAAETLVGHDPNDRVIADDGALQISDAH